ncbi:UDP-N-acetylmuramoyl-tripeptide--D-alanyl-D-alanine ligase [Candidatus Peribacteria bacterium]|nr:UDP-N-acetylmuramoyl-tripeptide--D-alanyl-D-alanine ligase [Candidatus Peribacteria bacterium]
MKSVLSCMIPNIPLLVRYAVQSCFTDSGELEETDAAECSSALGTNDDASSCLAHVHGAHQTLHPHVSAAEFWPLPPAVAMVASNARAIIVLLALLSGCPCACLRTCLCFGEACFFLPISVCENVAVIIQLLTVFCNYFSCYAEASMSLLLPILAVAGALSPLLTLAWLWQVKEWRWDRLLEHLRREGWIGQLWGKSRPLVIALYIVIVLIPVGIYGLSREALTGLLGVLLATAFLSIVQIGLRRQHKPIMTKKAITVTGTAGLVTVGLSLYWSSLLESAFLLPFLILLQPLTLTIAWLLWYPVDMILKRRILSRAKAARNAHPDLTVIGVTGSVGKTTTKELLACVLKDLQPAVTPAYLNAEIGVARWLAKTLQSGPEPVPGPVIVEMGAYRKGEIATLCSFTKPTLGVVTHVGTQHIALFGSQEKLFEAKSELVQSLPTDGRAFLNGDNDLTRKMASISPCPSVIVGTGGSCDLEAFDIEETSGGVRFKLVLRSLGEGGAQDIAFDVPLLGTHNVTNILLAIAVGEHLGVKLERMRDLLRTFTPLSKTFSVRTEAGVRILDDTHNSSIASMKAAIAWARSQPEERKILLTAGLIEMGDMQSPAEQELGALAATIFDRVIVIDPQSAANFGAGGTTVEILSKKSATVPSGSLLVCAGRMAGSSIQKILPSLDGTGVTR